MGISGLTAIFAWIIYVALALIALWGAFCVVLVWMRVAKIRFRTEEAQTDFLQKLDQPLATGDFDTAAGLCEGDPRAIAQLALLAITSRDIGYAAVRQLLLERFQRDVLSDLEYRLSWVYTVIKSAPMVGLLGTVIGMMGAFGEVADLENIDSTILAENISFALVTTACGLAIAIPLVFCTASISVRIRKLEDLVGSGLTRFLERFRAALSKPPVQKREN